ncbi:MAG: hypothetical protein U1F98_06630 [Verrucomicrobiota bacterium]
MKRAVAFLGLGILSGLVSGGMAQTFVGSNVPGQGTNYTFTIGAGATNLSLVISNNATAYSYLLLSKGGVPTDAAYDYGSRLAGVTNRINLELPEFSTGSYGLRVSTPAGSLAQSFTVVLTTNRSDLRTAANPVSKPLVFSTTGSLTNTGSGAWHYFQVDVGSNLVTGWRIVLSSTNATTPGLYVRRGQLPNTGAYDKAVAPGLPVETITFRDYEATNSTYFIGVYQPSGAASVAGYTLSAELASVTTLTWDPGTADAGTQVFTNKSVTGGDYYFAITTQTTADQVWRTALTVVSNEADVYLALGTLPTTGSYGYASTRVGSDGFVLSQTHQWTPGQTWYLMVHAAPGAQWRLVTGEAYVQPLPALAADASSGATAAIGPEGMRFFKTTITTNTLAWRLGLNGLGNQLYVKQSAAPHPYSTSTYDLTQPGQMLVVPTYLNVGSQYFVGVSGNPGQAFTLDSRQQAVTNLNFNATTNFTVTGYGYTTFLVQVPVQQIAWQVNVTPISGNASVAVRRDNVPNEFVNDAFSEPPAGTGASLTLVPPTLSNGSFYVTVYGTGPYTVSLFNGQPVITTVDYVFNITNDAPSRVGWRYYTVINTAEQLSTLGWGLDLSNQVPGTMIAIRRNAVPGQWNYRNNPYDYYGSSTSGYMDLSGTLGFLQQPNHQADVWYIGVYTPAAALGNFVLTGSQLTGPPVGFDGSGSAMSVTNQPSGKFQYFTFTVPSGALGWDVRLTNVTAGQPALVVCRDQLPYDLGTHTSQGYAWYPYTTTTWLSGNQWGAAYDWTSYYYSPTNGIRYGQMLEMGMGNPLQPGTYYVGVFNYGSSGPMSYTLWSRGIGSGMSIPVNTLTFSNGVVSSPGLPAGEAAYYSIVVPTNLPSWRLELNTNSGESLLMLQKDYLPSVSAGGGAPYNVSGGRKLQKSGNEQYLLMPAYNQSNIVAGTYYLAVAAEGQNPYNSTIGSNSSSFTLHSYGVQGVTNLGAVDPTGVTEILVTNSSEAGQLSTFQFNVPAGTLGFTVSLSNRVGNPMMILRTDSQLTGGYDGYGVDGGQGYSWVNQNMINQIDPPVTNYTLMIQAIASGGDASYVLHIRAMGAQPVTFDGGKYSVTNQLIGTWRFFNITVPPDSFGWDVRLTNVTSGAPVLAICRDLAPYDLGTHTPQGYAWYPYQSTTWPSGNQWGAGYDWTQYYYDPDGTVRYGQMLQMGMGNPLQPGNYIVGVINSGGAAPMSYTLWSRGIGTNQTIPVGSLTFSNGVVSNPALLAGEAAYYSIVVPTNLPSWRLELNTNGGEGVLMLQKDYLPNVSAAGGVPYNVNGGRRIQKSGNEQYLLMPAYNQSNIVAGTYYLAVAAEGRNPYSSYIGSNSTTFTLHSYGVLGVTNVGTVDNTGLTDILVTNSAEAGQLNAYEFVVPPGTLSLTLSLSNRVGSPIMILRTGSQLTGGYDGYGVDGGQSYSWVNQNLINIANPVATNYTIMIQAIASGGDASCVLYLHAQGPQPVGFDGGSYPVVGQSLNTWRYFSVTVPATAFGWDLRLTNITSGSPGLAVCRDLTPSDLGTHTSQGYAWYPQLSTSWPSGNQWGAGYDWTQYYYDPNGAVRYQQTLQMGMGNPLQPGNYIVGVINNGGSAAMSYTLLSRGIGTNLSIPILPLVFTNGAITNSGLLGRDAAYYSIVVPTNLPSWSLELSNGVGESLLMLQKDYLPSVAAAGAAPYTVNGGKRMQKPGNEQYTMLPVSGQSNIAAGTYYIAIASEGMNPYNSYLGTNSSSFVLYSYGVKGVTNFGPVGGVDLLSTNTLRGGQDAFYRFNIPNGAQAVEVRLDNVTGGPYLTLAAGSNLPTPYYNYGYDGGVPYSWYSPTLITLPNPVFTNYSLTLQASANVSSTYLDAQATVHIRQMPVPQLAFDGSLNGGGVSNSASDTVINGQSAFYQVTVPATLNGQPVIGWKLDLIASVGSPSLRVRPGALPDDYNSYYDGTTPWVKPEAIIVPPFLTPGTWYIEVRGSGISTYTLTSSALQLKRPAWIMPPVGGLVTTPGLPSAGPLFGDTGVDTNGVPLAGDQGIDLAQGAFDYYAIVVPANNTAVLRTRLDAISGNPNLFIRVGAPSTLSHYLNGSSGATLYDRSLNASGGSEYGNWVPLNGRFEVALTSGTWYVAVQAGGNSNVRYRLRFDTGTIKPLALNGGSYSAQTLVAGDFAYYAVQIPSNAPLSWNITYSVQFGNMVVSIRDRVPPGQATTTSDFRDWSSGLDSKNAGPYPSYSLPGTYTVHSPPLRPGNTYYLGFRALIDSTFALSCNTNVGTIDFTNVIPFYHGFASSNLPAFGSVKYRVDVPPDAVRWIHFCTNASSVWLYLEQGTVPTLTTSDHWYAQYANNSLNLFLQTPGFWPWQPGYSYYLVATNTSGAVQPFTLVLNGEGPGSGPFGFTNSVYLGGGSVQLGIYLVPGLTYALQTSTNLVNWTVVNTLTPVTNLLYYTDTQPVQPARFYRLLEQ